MRELTEHELMLVAGGLTVLALPVAAVAVAGAAKGTGGAVEEGVAMASAFTTIMTNLRH